MCKVCSGTLRISLGINPCKIPQKCTEYELPATFNEKLKTQFFVIIIQLNRIIIIIITVTKFGLIILDHSFFFVIMRHVTPGTKEYNMVCCFVYCWPEGGTI
jgi:hypothetical protein